MSDLSEKKCVPCEGGIPPFDTTEIHKYLKKVDGWNVKENEFKNFYLIKEFKFENFLKSQNFVNKVGEIAEKEGKMKKKDAENYINQTLMKDEHRYLRDVY